MERERKWGGYRGGGKREGVGRRGNRKRRKERRGEEGKGEKNSYSILTGLYMSIPKIETNAHDYLVL